MVSKSELEQRHIWSNIDKFLTREKRRADQFVHQLNDAKINREFEKQVRLSRLDDDPELERFLQDVWPETGTANAIKVAQELKEKAYAKHVFVFDESDDATREQLDLYRAAAKLNPNDAEAISCAAKCFSLMGEYDRASKKMVHLAVLAKQNQDIVLAESVLNNPTVVNLMQDEDKPAMLHSDNSSKVVKITSFLRK